MTNEERHAKIYELENNIADFETILNARHGTEKWPSAYELHMGSMVSKERDWMWWEFHRHPDFENSTYLIFKRSAAKHLRDSFLEELE
jgi:hypothetical protein